MISLPPFAKSYGNVFEQFMSSLSRKTFVTWCSSAWTAFD